ncbi:hypothetical protein [Oceanospirillum sediminis]|uniref:Uncharacterized protein n=1 Tax=Oceanospirillum sediminis TaxID=2760088 RepID=A0A839ITV2_9GAMM|nr:hypothetical protein [Oceanospirillum sediminis]MBB1488765.1 hypothetical protein [Oceanospirillum sediminis]
MEKFHCLVDSSFNLLKASERNQSELQGAIKEIESSTKSLNSTAQDIESRVASAVTASSREATEYIVKKVLSNLREAEKNADRASTRFEKAAKFSVLKIGVMFFLFFLMAGALLWFMFIKNIPTIDEINRLKNEKSILVGEIASLKQYGEVSRCDGKPCIQVDNSTWYGGEEMPYYIIIRKQ